jgi:tetratricopeptide (TPR) repeat protein
MGESDGQGHRHTGGCDDGGCARLEAEGDVALTRLILDGGGDLDLGHAASHVAGAVGSDPGLPEAYEALAALVARAGGPQAALELFPEEQRYAGTLACRAALLAAVGRESEAVALLGAVIGAAPTLPWARVAWMARPDLADVLDPGAVGSTLAHVTQAIGDPADAGVRAALEPYYALVRAVVARHPEQPRLVAMASSLARRMDDLDTAIAWAGTVKDFRSPPSGDALGVVMLGSALRRAGRVEETFELWSATVRDDASQTYLAVDLAETLAAHGRPQEGVAILERVLASEPDHEKAAPAIHALRYQITPDTAHLLALHEHFQQHPDHDYAAYLLRSRCGGRPWLGRIDGGTEAVTNAMRQLTADHGPVYEHEVRMSLSGLEPPSSILAARLAAPRLRIDVAQVGTPDPREAVREVGVRVWRYEGTAPLPAVPEPSERALAAARELAWPNWACPPALYEHAAPLGELSLSDLLGLLVHPPAPADATWPDGFAQKAPDVWLRTVQTVACVGIAHHRPEQPWAGSERRGVLLDLLDGLEDWVCEAAGMALVAVGWTFPEPRGEIAARLLGRLNHAMQAAQTRPVTILASLCRLVLACGWLEPEVGASVRELLAAAVRQDEADEPGETDETDGADGASAKTGQAGA